MKEINGYILLSKYIDNETECTFRCKKCGNTFNAIPHQLKRKTEKGHCPFCEVTTKNTTLEQAIWKLDQITDEYKIVNYYGFSPNTGGFDLKHTKCGTVFNTNSYRFIYRGQRCPKCCEIKQTAYTTEEYKKKIFDLVGDEYTLVSEYVNEKTKIKLLHHKCNKIYEVLPRNFMYQQTRCNCTKTKSKHEIMISDLLTENNIKFEQEVKFDGLIGRKNSLRFDFKIYLNDDDFILLEYDGRQHFHGMRTDTADSIEIREEADKKKNQYCLDNNIKLIRIPYTCKFKNLKSLMNLMIKRNFNLSATTIEQYGLYYNNEQRFNYLDVNNYI